MYKIDLREVCYEGTIKDPNVYDFFVLLTPECCKYLKHILHAGTEFEIFRAIYPFTRPVWLFSHSLLLYKS